MYQTKARHLSGDTTSNPLLKMKADRKEIIVRKPLIESVKICFFSIPTYLRK